MVTLLTPLEPEPDPEPDPELEPEPEPVLDDVVVVAVVVGGVDATLVADEDVEVLRASAGSWPETSTIVIISQAATNTATAPEMTRRRIVRARAARSFRSAWARALAAFLLSVGGGVMGRASSRAVSAT